MIVSPWQLQKTHLIWKTILLLAERHLLLVKSPQGSFLVNYAAANLKHMRSILGTRKSNWLSVYKIHMMQGRLARPSTQ
jgi:hypothetical protein